MGFISSILCCLTDSPKSKTQSQVNSGKKVSQITPINSSSKKSAIHSSLSNSSQKMIHGTRPVNSKNIDKKSGSKEKELENDRIYSKSNDNVTDKGRAPTKKRYNSTNTNLTKKRGQAMRAPPIHGLAEMEKDSDNEKKDSENGEVEEVNDDDNEGKETVDTPNKDKEKLDVDASNEKETQAVYVYNGETDTSTGGSSYDHPQQKANQEPFQPHAVGTVQPSIQTETTSPNQPRSLNEQELITTVHEGENYSSADDTDTGLQKRSSNNDEEGDYDMAPPYEEDEEYFDLTELQPGQTHAMGFNTLLAPQDPKFSGKKCLVLDLDETLVHSSFKYIRTADFVLPVDIDDQIHNVYVIKRPGVDEFLKRVGALYEVVVFTASVSRYGDPLLDILDKHKMIHHRLFRESCYNYEGNYIKNLSQIGRPLSEIIILDNSPASYIFHPQHAIPISSWFSDTHDNELLDIIPLLEDLSERSVPDVGKVLDVTI